MTDPNLPFSAADVEALAEQAVAAALRAGAAAAAATVSCGGGLRAVMQDGALDSVVRDGFQSVQLQVWCGGGGGFATATRLQPDALAQVAADAVAIAGEVEADPAAGLPDPSWHSTLPEVILHDPQRPDAVALRESAVALDRAARDAGVRTVGAGASSGVRLTALANSNGFHRSQLYSNNGRWCDVIAEDGDGMVTGFDVSEHRRWQELAPEEAIAGRAAARALARRGARAVASGTARVLFESHCAWSLVNTLALGLMGGRQVTGATVFAGCVGQRIAADGVGLREDPALPWGAGSAAFDSEGVAPSARDVILDGVAQGYFLDSLSARRLRLRPTGNADGCCNLSFTGPPGAGGGLDAMLRRLDTGLMVTGLLGGMADQVTGRWHHAVEGFWVENGAVAHPVRDITLSGDFAGMMLAIEAVGDDVHQQGVIRSGSILVGAMRIGGTP